jgi:hypothetical protein
LNRAYLEAIEAAFLSRSGRGLMLSSRDIELVSRWARANAPVSVVVDGIDRAFEHHDGRRPVRGLAYVAPAVEEAISAWRARRVGSAEHSPATETAGEANGGGWDVVLGAVEGAGRAQPTEARRAACRQCWQSVVSLRRRHAAGLLTDPYEALDEVAEAWADDLFDALDAAQQAALEAELEEALAPERSVCNGDEFAVLRRAQRRRRVRDGLGLPDLSSRFG